MYLFNCRLVLALFNNTHTYHFIPLFENNKNNVKFLKKKKPGIFIEKSPRFRTNIFLYSTFAIVYGRLCVFVMINHTRTLLWYCFHFLSCKEKCALSNGIVLQIGKQYSIDKLSLFVYIIHYFHPENPDFAISKQIYVQKFCLLLIFICKFVLFFHSIAIKVNEQENMEIFLYF